MIGQFIINGLEAGAAYGLVALGFGLIYRVCGFFNFAHGAVYTVAAYLAYTFIHILGCSPWIGIPISIIGAMALGAATETVIYRPMRRWGASSLTLLICSLGILVAIQNGISLIFGDDTKRLRSTDVYQSVIIFGAHITSIQLVIIGTSILLCVSIAFWMRLTGFGKMARAIASDADLATVVGVNSPRTIVIIFALGSALAAVASILLGYDTDLTPAIGFNALLMAVVAVSSPKQDAGNSSGQRWGPDGRGEFAPDHCFRWASLAIALASFPKPVRRIQKAMDTHKRMLVPMMTNCIEVI